jgi:hypothetical protein
MTLYHSLANAIGTREALELAHRLSSWHDAMVVHQRRAGRLRGTRCDVDCPHAEAKALWAEALAAYGERADELRFLRTHGGSAFHDRSNRRYSEARL